MKDGMVNSVTETEEEALRRQSLLGQLVVDDDSEDIFFDGNDISEKVSTVSDEDTATENNEDDFADSHTEEPNINESAYIEPESMNETESYVPIELDSQESEDYLPEPETADSILNLEQNPETDTAYDMTEQDTEVPVVKEELPVSENISSEEEMPDDNISLIRTEMNEKYRRGNIQTEDILRYMSVVSESVLEAGMERQLASLKAKYADCEQTGELVKYFIELKRLYRDAVYKTKGWEL